MRKYLFFYVMFIRMGNGSNRAKVLRGLNMCFVDLFCDLLSFFLSTNSNVGAWLPKAKEMMPFWWYFQPSFNCPYEVERVGRFNDGGKVCLSCAFV